MTPAPGDFAWYWRTIEIQRKTCGWRGKNLGDLRGPFIASDARLFDLLHFSHCLFSTYAPHPALVIVAEEETLSLPLLFFPSRT